MSDCGSIDFADGATIANSIISSATVIGSDLSGCNLVSSAIGNLSSIDSASAERIGNAIAQLPTEALMQLASAIAAAMPQCTPGLSPATTTEETLPTAVAGERNLLLGSPVTWLKTGDFVVPAYRQE